MGGARVEYDAERALGVLFKGHRLWDKVAEACGREVGGWVEEIDGLDGDVGRERGGAEGGDYEVVVCGFFVVGCLGDISGSNLGGVEGDIRL